MCETCFPQTSLEPVGCTIQHSMSSACVNAAQVEKVILGNQRIAHKVPISVVMRKWLVSKGRFLFVLWWNFWVISRWDSCIKMLKNFVEDKWYLYWNKWNYSQCHIAFSFNMYDLGNLTYWIPFVCICVYIYMCV